MKKSIVIILACICFYPYISRSQNENVKPVASQNPSTQVEMRSTNAGEMAMIMEQGTGGGAPMESGLTAENSPLYLEPGWATGNVYLKDKTELRDVLLR